MPVQKTKEHKRKGRAVFITSLCISMVVLSALFLLFMLYTKTLEVEAEKPDVPAEYRPQPEENLTCVLFGCREAADEPELILVLSYRAPAGELTALLLPPETVCEVNGRKDTLAGHYEYEGVRGGRNGVKSLLNLDSLRFLRTDWEGLSTLTDFLGGVEYDIPYDCEIGGEQFWKGRQLLDGRRLVTMLFALDGFQSVDTGRQAELTGLLLRRGLNAGLPERYGRLSTMLFSCCETDLSQYDFLLRKQGFCQGLEDGTLQIDALTLKGEYSALKTSFTPDPASLEEVRKKFAV